MDLDQILPLALSMPVVDKILVLLMINLEEKGFVH